MSSKEDQVADQITKLIDFLVEPDALGSIEKQIEGVSLASALLLEDRLRKGISRLTTIDGNIASLEAILFSESTLTKMDNKQLLELYKVSRENLRDTLTMIRGVSEELEWKKIGTQALITETEKQKLIIEGEQATEVKGLLEKLLELSRNKGKDNLLEGKKVIEGETEDLLE